MTGSMAYSSFPPSASIDRYDAYDVGDITLQSTTSNIDDEVYRYSAEFDRQQYFESMLKSPSGFAGLGVSIPGIPRSGLYAQDGLWDEDDGISDSTTLRPVSGSTVGTGQTARHSSKASPSTMNASASTKSRDRSGTASSAVQPITLESRESKSWSWNRKSATPATPIISEVPSSPAISQTPESKRGRVHSLKSQRSKSRLRGKGRKGELSVDVGNDPDESFEAPPRLPPTPASFVSSASPALSTDSFLSPNLPLRSTYDQENSPQVPPSQTAQNPRKSSWKRGMVKIFRSKSSIALREAFGMADPNLPPVPTRPDGLPKANPTVLGPAFSSSTPPLPSQESRKDIWGLYGSIYSPPTTATSSTFGFHQSHLPPDPFANATSPTTAEPISPMRSPVARHSPSFKDLKNFLAPRPQLTKAKSLANIREKLAETTTARPSMSDLSELPPVPPQKVAIRTKSAVALSSQLSARPNDAVRGDSTLYPLPRPHLTRMPTESPPLFPPHPPFFPASGSGPSSPSAPKLTLDLSVLSSPPPPSTPLPAPPVSSPVATVQRSASGAVLLPRSRSTSMSLKSPPTSSSFFDLYEQLGIWPTSSSEKSASRDVSVDRSQKVSADARHGEEHTAQQAPALPEPVRGKAPDLEPLPEDRTISTSPSAAFSLGSWEAAISAFPIIDDAVPNAGSVLDFGEPTVADDLGVDNLLDTSPVELIDDSPGINVAAVLDRASNCSASQRQGAYQSSGGGQQASNRTAGSSSLNMPRNYGKGGSGLGGSGGSERSSKAGSRDERLGGYERGRQRLRRGSSTSSSDYDEEEEDDVPLSHLHPEAAARQEEKAKRRAARRLARATRNPGAGTGWNGEGGVPADILAKKLELVLIKGEERKYPWQRAMRSYNPMEPPAAPLPTVPASVAPQRSHTEPVQAARGPVTHPGGATRRPILPAASDARADRVGGHLSPSPVMVSSQPRQSAGPSPASQISPQVPSAASISRSETTRSSASTQKGRPRGLSNADSMSRFSDSSHSRSATNGPIAPVRQPFIVPAIIGHMGGPRLMLEVYSETTARDILHNAEQRGQLKEPTPGYGWVVVEIFGEYGCERHLREYETIQSVVHGWDPAAAGKNLLLLCQSRRAASTWARTIPTTAPFVGGYVQYETKKGKWSKKYLETRGGQVFLAKNEKNKEEVQINTLFHDVYSLPRPKGAPKSFVFMMKRNEQASRFPNHQDYSYTFSTDDQVGFKLLTAIYEAKSLAMSQSMPQIMAQQSSAQATRRRTETQESSPLINLGREKKEERSAFTGKGLLKI